MNKEEIIKQFIYTLEDDIKNKTFLTYEEENEWKDYLERIINSQVNKYKEVLDKIKEELTGDFNFEVYICNDNKGSGKTMKLGASIYRNMILEKLNELLEEIE